MKLKGFFQDRAAQPCEISGATFYVKPLSAQMMARVESVQIRNTSDYLPLDERIKFAKNNIEGWENLFYDNDEEVEFTKENAIDLLTKEEYDDLCFELFEFAYTASLKLKKKTAKDSEAAGK